MFHPLVYSSGAQPRNGRGEGLCAAAFGYSMREGSRLNLGEWKHYSVVCLGGENCATKNTLMFLV